MGKGRQRGGKRWVYRKGGMRDRRVGEVTEGKGGGQKGGRVYKRKGVEKEGEGIPSCREEGQRGWEV